jgi:hypothetical protein
MWTGDGAADLIVTQLNAPPVLLRNVGANKNHFVRLDLTGFADNKTALGVKVEVFAAALAEVGTGRRFGLPDAGAAADSGGAGRCGGHRSAAHSVADGRAAG